MPERLDPDRLRDFSKRVFGSLGGALTAAMILLGDRLGLYRALAEGGAATSAELAQRTGLDERWVREWLHQQGAAHLLDWDDDERFSLSAEARVVLAEEHHPAFAAGSFDQLPGLIGVLEHLPEAFRTGRGLPYDAFGEEGARGVARGFAPWVENFLVPVAIEAVPGLPARLDEGARVADVGCGAGAALLELARAFPKAELHGYELSRHALEHADASRSERGLANVRFHHVEEEPLPDRADFDLVLTFDCLHDMTHPGEVMGAIRRAIRDDGVWMIADIKARPSFAENVERNPMAALMYGFSVTSCMSSALSAPGGAGLGTLGLHPGLCESMTRDAGFTRFRKLEIEHPVNAFYEVRP